MTHVSVALSSICQLPLVANCLGDEEQIAVLTANGESLTFMADIMEGYLPAGSTTGDKPKFVIQGCENVPGFEAVALGEKVDAERVTPGMVKLVQDLLKAKPCIRAILLECTELPQFADAIRNATKLPVFDSITCANMMMFGAQYNPKFGKDDWQFTWDGKIDDYSYGDNLSPAEKERLLNPVAAKQ